MNDWHPFVYGGFASVTAECGEFSTSDTLKISCICLTVVFFDSFTL